MPIINSSSGFIGHSFLPSILHIISNFWSFFKLVGRIHFEIIEIGLSICFKNSISSLFNISLYDVESTNLYSYVLPLQYPLCTSPPSIVYVSKFWNPYK